MAKNTFEEDKAFKDRHKLRGVYPIKLISADSEAASEMGIMPEDDRNHVKQMMMEIVHGIIRGHDKTNDSKEWKIEENAQNYWLLTDEPFISGMDVWEASRLCCEFVEYYASRGKLVKEIGQQNLICALKFYGKSVKSIESIRMAKSVLLKEDMTYGEYESLEELIPKSAEIDVKEDEDNDNDEQRSSCLYSPRFQQSMDSLVLDESVTDAVDTMMRCYSHRKELSESGLVGSCRLILAGPPGNGKTALAGAIAREMDLPMFMMDMSQIRGSHIGQTGKAIGKVFEEIEKTVLGKCLLFLDECDSIACSRMYEQGADREDSASLNVLLTKLDNALPDTIIIAATNHPEELDAAFMRRFTQKCWLEAPTDKQIDGYISRFADEHCIKFTKQEQKEIAGLYGSPWSKTKEFCTNILTGRIIGKNLPSGTRWIGRKDCPQKQAIGFR